MTDLVERIARALWEDEYYAPWAEVTHNSKEDFRGHARAALAEIERTHAVVPSRCFIPLSNGGFTLVSEQDIDRVLAAGNWFAVRKNSGLYACRSFGRNNRIYLHRFLTDAGGTVQVDHINGNTLDNRRGNLRIASWSENNRNRLGAQRNSASGIRGVYWHKQRNKWCANIRHQGKQIALGLFETVEEACQARRAAEERLWTPIDRYRELAASSKAGQ